MINIWIIIIILFVHWVADFISQSDWSAKNKSRSLVALLIHGATYSVFWIPFGFRFWLITLITHTAIDFITSRINTKLWDNKKVHWFFVSIGFDQLLHYVQLFLTYLLIKG